MLYIREAYDMEIDFFSRVLWGSVPVLFYKCCTTHLNFIWISNPSWPPRRHWLEGGPASEARERCWTQYQELVRLACL